ncbi:MULTISPECIES: hypothetical protein [Aliivibrio]|uniref:Uncharacterized protein n=1 Tax=Aliivibrio logei TaxID=688 RepID=A0A1B9NW13_ALILO|nr:MULTISPECIES: hypothetical protein [Aliivibrio]MBD1571546.1 hypothetical protein [Aliivibrio sp. S10_S31]OCH19094.1 hypothetical protein A6E04_16920 [Aliivibrio logei]
MYNKEYKLLAQEGHLTMTSLLGGLNSIRRANIDENHRGLFYLGLFELATGFERLFKIVLILDHKISNKCQTPTNQELRSFGHDIEKLYAKCVECSSNYSLHSEISLNDKQKQIIEVLAKFAKGSRYYNLDELTENNKNDDPIGLWLDVIDRHVWGLRSDVRKRIEQDAITFIDRNGLATNWKQNINGDWITILEFTYLRHTTEKASYHVVWSIIDMLRPFYYVLQYQTYRIHQLNVDNNASNEVPHMYEFFPFFLTPKSSVLRKKKWAWGE